MRSNGNLELLNRKRAADASDDNDLEAKRLALLQSTTQNKNRLEEMARAFVGAKGAFLLIVC